jgi:hypothetical protein
MKTTLLAIGIAALPIAAYAQCANFTDNLVVASSPDIVTTNPDGSTLTQHVPGGAIGTLAFACPPTPPPPPAAADLAVAPATTSLTAGTDTASFGAANNAGFNDYFITVNGTTKGYAALMIVSGGALYAYQNQNAVWFKFVNGNWAGAPAP